MSPSAFPALRAAQGTNIRAVVDYSDCSLIRSQVSSRVTVTPSIFDGGGVNTMRSPSKWTLRTCGAVKRTGSQLASTVGMRVLPSKV